MVDTGFSMDDDEDDGSGPADIYGQENEDEQMEDTDAQLDALLSQEAEEEEDIKEAMFKAVDAAAVSVFLCMGAYSSCLRKQLPQGAVP